MRTATVNALNALAVEPAPRFGCPRCKREDIRRHVVTGRLYAHNTRWRLGDRCPGSGELALQTVAAGAS